VIAQWRMSIQPCSMCTAMAHLHKKKERTEMRRRKDAEARAGNRDWPSRHLFSGPGRARDRCFEELPCSGARVVATASQPGQSVAGRPVDAVDPRGTGLDPRSDAQGHQMPTRAMSFRGAPLRDLAHEPGSICAAARRRRLSCGSHVCWRRGGRDWSALVTWRRVWSRMLASWSNIGELAQDLSRRVSNDPPPFRGSTR
jgi:hypothetical protein